MPGRNKGRPPRKAVARFISPTRPVVPRILPPGRPKNPSRRRRAGRWSYYSIITGRSEARTACHSSYRLSARRVGLRG